MATLNPFDLLDGDIEDPSLFVAAGQKKQLPPAPVSKKGPAQPTQQPKPAAKLPSKPLPPSEAGTRGRFRGGRRGGFSNGDAVDGEHPRRAFECRSGTGRGYKFKREGAGRGKWGAPTDELALEKEQSVNEGEKIVDAEKQAGQTDAADTNKDSPVVEPQEKEPEEKEMTLEEYEKVIEEKRKALLAPKPEERKVNLDKEFESMQLLSNKKSDDEVFIKLCGNLVLHLVWLILHFIINVWYFVLGIARMVEITLISNGLLKSYNAVNISKVRYLAVVIESEEARETSKVLELLCWVASIGIKTICLYDREGVLKKSQTAIIEGLNKSQKGIVEGSDHGTLVEHVDLEFVSFADSKPAVAKAANLLFAKHYAGTKSEKPTFTESDMSDSLQAVGYAGPEPDLLLVYGPVRCHMGFPAWRIRYTEIVHMGTLKSMNSGSLIQAIHKFTKVHQNYGR